MNDEEEYCQEKTEQSFVFEATYYSETDKTKTEEPLYSTTFVPRDCSFSSKDRACSHSEVSTSQEESLPNCSHENGHSYTTYDVGILLQKKMDSSDNLVVLHQFVYSPSSAQEIFLSTSDSTEPSVETKHTVHQKEFHSSSISFITVRKQELRIAQRCPIYDNSNEALIKESKEEILSQSSEEAIFEEYWEEVVHHSEEMPRKTNEKRLHLLNRIENTGREYERISYRTRRWPVEVPFAYLSIPSPVSLNWTRIDNLGNRAITRNREERDEIIGYGEEWEIDERLDHGMDDPFERDEEEEWKDKMPLIHKDDEVKIVYPTKVDAETSEEDARRKMDDDILTECTVAKEDEGQNKNIEMNMQCLHEIAGPFDIWMHHAGSHHNEPMYANSRNFEEGNKKESGERTIENKQMEEVFGDIIVLSDRIESTVPSHLNEGIIEESFDRVHSDYDEITKDENLYEEIDEYLITNPEKYEVFRTLGKTSTVAIDSRRERIHCEYSEDCEELRQVASPEKEDIISNKVQLAEKSGAANKTASNSFQREPLATSSRKRGSFVEMMTHVWNSRMLREEEKNASSGKITERFSKKKYFQRDNESSIIRSDLLEKESQLSKREFDDFYLGDVTVITNDGIHLKESNLYVRNSYEETTEEVIPSPHLESESRRSVQYIREASKTNQWKEQENEGLSIQSNHSLHRECSPSSHKIYIPSSCKKSVTFAPTSQLVQYCEMRENDLCVNSSSTTTEAPVGSSQGIALIEAVDSYIRKETSSGKRITRLYERSEKRERDNTPTKSNEAGPSDAISTENGVKTAHLVPLEILSFSRAISFSRPPSDSFPYQLSNSNHQKVSVETQTLQMGIHNGDIPPEGDASIKMNDEVLSSSLVQWDPTALVNRLYEVSYEPRMETKRSRFINMEGHIEVPNEEFEEGFERKWIPKYAKTRDGRLQFFVTHYADAAPAEEKLVSGAEVEASRDERLIRIIGGRSHLKITIRVPSSLIDKWREALLSHAASSSIDAYVRPIPSALPHINQRVLIIELGGCSIRGGILTADPSLPSSFFPAIAAVLPNGKIAVGAEAYLPENRLGGRLVAPLSSSDPSLETYSINIDVMRACFHKVLIESKIDPTAYKVLVSLSQNIPSILIEDIMKILMNDLSFQGVAVTRQPSLVLYAYDVSTGVVVDIGDKLSIIPVVDGYMVESGIVSLPYGGRQIQDCLRRQLAHTNNGVYGQDKAIDALLLRNLMEETSFVSQNAQDESQNAKTVTVSLSSFNPLPSMPTSLQSDNSRFLATEGIFAPKKWNIDGKGLHQLIHESIQNSPIDSRRVLYRNIYLAGGASLLPGLAERLESELAAIVPTSIHAQVHISPWRYNAAFLGAQIVACSSAFEDSCITASSLPSFLDKLRSSAF